MIKHGDPSPIPYILITCALLAGGYGWFYLRNQTSTVNTPVPTTSPVTTNTPPAAPVPTTTPAAGSFPPPTTVASGTQVRIDGSTSMVSINQNLKSSFEQQFPGTTVIPKASGSDQGIQNILAGNVDIAAISRPLTPQEQSQGLVAVPIATDAIAVVVGVYNSFTGGLTPGQVEDIFEGDITNWSQVGGSASTIRVINRPAISGTHQAFKELVLGGENFGTTANITTLSQDATTPLLRALGNDGIGYATHVQVMNQKTVRSLAVNGVLPDHPTYPYKRILYYVYKNPASPAVQAFLGYATSPQGKQVISTGN
ncbi:MAG: phosphate ABC transporter substrate-binding protein [Coleofasciculus sp. C1-SOL-03]|jgi:phosphate transport system substrate-binding protein|uniref:phosphate ABC transporter substrate-binding protein n=1 Tax=Coleofasciculus sp. C1-SOL-03 TaxID=3069522 RepID=UPI00330473AF